MKRILKLSVIVTLATLLLVSMEFMGNSQYTRSSKFAPLSAEMLDFLLIRIEEVGNETWNKNEYEAILSDLLLYRNHELIKQSVYDNMLYTLRLEYAESLEKSYKNWIRNCQNNSPERLFNEMVEVANFEGCSKFLNTGISAIKSYRLAVGSRSAVVRFYIGAYDEQRYQNLLRRVTSFINNSELKQCNNLVTELYTNIGQLEEFIRYAKDFEAYYAIYTDTAASYTDKLLMNNYCPENNDATNKYTYYRNMINQLRICD